MPWLCNKGDVSEPGVVVLCWGGVWHPAVGRGKLGFNGETTGDSENAMEHHMVP